MNVICSRYCSLCLLTSHCKHSSSTQLPPQKEPNEKSQLLLEPVRIPLSKTHLNYIKMLWTVYLTFCKINLSKNSPPKSMSLFVSPCFFWYTLYKQGIKRWTRTRYSVFRWWVNSAQSPDLVFRPSVATKHSELHETRRHVRLCLRKSMYGAPELTLVNIKY